MLFLIAIANVPIFLWGSAPTSPTFRRTDGSLLDTVLDAGAAVFIDARIYPMFAFLFGYGMVQFLVSRWNRGMPRAVISRMLLRRHLWLLVFGTVHAVLLFEGDILGAYGLTGLVIAPLFLWGTDRAIRWTAGVLAGLLALGTGAVVALTVVLGSVFGESVTDFNLGSSGASEASLEFSGAAVANPWLAMLLRFGIWALATPITVLALTVPLAMLLGVLAARHRWLEGGGSRVPLVGAAAVGLCVAVLAGLPVAVQTMGLWEVGWAAEASFTLVSQSFGVCGGVGYVALVALLAQRMPATPGRLSLAVAAIGQRSLTFYLLQSVIFSPLLSRWALGLGEQLSLAEAYALAAAVWLASIVLANLLARRGARGPAESLLRRLTYGSFDVSAPVGLR